MASANDCEASCESDPNFAVICGFLEKFGTICGVEVHDFHELQEMLEDTQQVSSDLVDLHVKLLRKARRTVSNDKWERAVVKVCHTYCSQDAWEIERFGYKKASLQAKLRLLKELMEMQFDCNVRFKTEINKMSSQELRAQPLGKDRMGRAYWYQCDENCQIRVYKEDPDDETWILVAKDRDGLASLISDLSEDDTNKSNLEPLINEDSNSLTEKPILDTGQPSESEETSESNSNSNNSDPKKEEEEPTPNTMQVASDESKKRKADEADTSSTAKRKRITRSSSKVDEAIEEPVMLIRGEGYGMDNQSEVSEAIEEPVRYFSGVGEGVDCQNGNNRENEDNSSDKLSNNGNNSIRYKLGTVMDSKTDVKVGSVKNSNRISRWDVGGPDEECEKTPDVPLKQPSTMFFFGPGCLKFNSPLQSFGSNNHVGEKSEEEQSNKASENCEVNNVEKKADEEESITVENNESKKVEIEESTMVANDESKTVEDNEPKEAESDESKRVEIGESTMVEIEDSKKVEDDESTKVESLNSTVDAAAVDDEHTKSGETIASVLESEDCDNAAVDEETTTGEMETTEVVQKESTDSLVSLDVVSTDGVTVESSESEDKKEEETTTTTETKSSDEQSDLLVVAEKSGNEEDVKDDKGESLESQNVVEESEETEKEVSEAVDTQIERFEENTENETENIEEPKINDESNGKPEEVINIEEQSAKQEEATLPKRTNNARTNFDIESVLKPEIKPSTTEGTANAICEAVTEQPKAIETNVVIESEKQTSVAICESEAETPLTTTEDCKEESKPSLLRVRNINELKEPPFVNCIQKTEENVDEQPKAPDEPEQQPVDEPLCIKKSFPLLTTETEKIDSPQSVISIQDSDSNGAFRTNEPETDPLALETPETPQPNEHRATTPQPSEQQPISLATFSMDFDEKSQTKAARRKRSHEDSERQPETEAVTVKKQKMRGKRPVDAQLRKSVEEKRSMAVSSSEEDERKVDEAKQEEEEDTKKAVEEEKVQKKPKKRKNRMLLGLDIRNIGEDNFVTGVRHSRRIAQIKIKEEAERRKLEEMAAAELKLQEKKKKSKQQKAEEKEYKADKSRRRCTDEEDDTTTRDTIDSDGRKKRKRKRKHEDPRKLFDAVNPWQSSSDSSSSSDEEEDLVEEYSEEEHTLKSDHEFSPESDLEDSAEVQPLKRARTARKESDVEPDDDYPCQKCGKTDHPEWILLCDGCDNGWHCSCLRPPLLVIPEGDWYCPPCQHAALLQNLETTLIAYDKKLNKRDIEDRRKKRLAYVGISLNNVLPPRHDETRASRVESDDRRNAEEGAVADGSDESGDDSDSGSYASSGSTGSDSEPIYQLRARRQAHSYRFTDYDDLINSAIQDELEMVKGAGNQGRGKDISTIVNAEKEELAQTPSLVVGGESETLPSVVPADVELKPYMEIENSTPAEEQQHQQADEDEEEEEEPQIRPVIKKLKGRKKPRKLNSLDISSEDDEDSDEDFKGTSSEDEEEEEDYASDFASSSSESYKRGKKGPIRRSTRARISRYDREFINDDSEDEAPRRKKTRSIWDDESDEESEDSDNSWGSVKKKKRCNKSNNKSKQRVTNATNKSKKKKKKEEESDPEVYKRKKPKIKFGKINSDEENVGIRTRGKKINYLDVLGSDSDEESVRRKPPKIVDSEDEFVLNEEELENEKEEEEEEEDDSEEEENGKQEAKQEDQTTVFTNQELNPIEEINKNVEEMDDKEMEKFMEEEEYANRQLQLVALQIEKEKKRREKEARKLEVLNLQETVTDDKSGKKRHLLPEREDENDELSEPPGVALPLFGSAEETPFSNNLSDNAPKKRRGRGKGKKTLAAEAAKAEAEARAKAADQEIPTNPEQLRLSIAPPPQPFCQSQPTPSVITRMLQSQPGHPNYPIQTFGEQPTQTNTFNQTRLVVPPPQPPPIVANMYRQGPPRAPPMPYAAPRSNGPPPPPSQHPTPPPVYPLRTTAVGDPSPSGGGLNLSTDRSCSPNLEGVAKGEGYVRSPQHQPIGRVLAGATVAGAVPILRHMPTTVPPPHHLTHQPPAHHHLLRNSSNSVPPPPPSPYHQQPPHPYYAYHEAGGAVPPAYAAYQAGDEIADAAAAAGKYEEDAGGGEFGGLVSYFSSQREDDLDT